MATTVTAATLTVEVAESITLNGVSRNSSTTASISSIGEISHSIMSITHSPHGTDIVNIGSGSGAGTFDKTAVKYLRFTNLDDTNFVTIQFTDEATHHWELKLEAGKSLVIGDTSSIDDQADIDNFSATAITKIIGIGVGAAVDLEVYIAST
jgi:hypothetical protein